MLETKLSLLQLIIVTARKKCCSFRYHSRFSFRSAFVLYTHDLTPRASSNVASFADNCALFREINDLRNVHNLQTDIAALSNPCSTWLMECKKMRITCTLSNHATHKLFCPSHAVGGTQPGKAPPCCRINTAYLIGLVLRPLPCARVRVAATRDTPGPVLPFVPHLCRPQRRC